MVTTIPAQVWSLLTPEACAELLRAGARERKARQGHEDTPLWRILDESGRKAADVASDVGLSEGGLRAILDGRVPSPRYSTARAIMRAMDVSLEEADVAWGNPPPRKAHEAEAEAEADKTPKKGKGKV